MGLDIRGEITRHHLGGSYSTLHHCTRWLSLVYCGLPEKIGKSNYDGEDIDSFVFYMHPFALDKSLDLDSMKSLLNAVMLAGYRFPNINLHSDCEGNYTKDGQLLDESWMTGNSLKLLEELELLCNDKEFIDFCSKNEHGQRAMEYTQKFRNLVKDEIENGCGTVNFS